MVKGETSGRSCAAFPLLSPPGCLRVLLQQGLALMDVLPNMPSLHWRDSEETKQTLCTGL